MPRAIGMFGHSLNPDYFINPPAFTYLLHVALRAPLGRRATRSATRSRPTRRRRSRSPAPPSARARRARRRRCSRGPARGCSTAARGRARRRRCCWRSRSCRCTTRTSRSTTSPTLAPLRSALVGIAGDLPRRGRHARLRARRRRRSGWRCATKYTAGIVLLPLLAAAAVASPASRCRAGSRGLALRRRCSGARRSWSPTRTRCSTATAFRDGLHAAVRGRRRRRRQARPGHRQRLTSTTCGTLTWGLRLAAAALAALGGAVGLVAARPAARADPRSPRRSLLVPLPRAARPASSRAGCCRSTRCSACSRRGRGVAGHVHRDPAAPPARRRRRARRHRRAGGAAGPRASPSTTTSCWPARTRASSRATGWSRTRPGGREGGRRADRRPTSGRWTRPSARAVTGNGNRWNKCPTSRSLRQQRRHAAQGRRPRGQARGLRAHDAPAADRHLPARRLLLGRDRLDAVRPRARRDPARCPTRSATTTSCAERGRRRLPRRARRKPARALLVRRLVQLPPARPTSGRGRRSSSTASATARPDPAARGRGRVRAMRRLLVVCLSAAAAGVAVLGVANAIVLGAAHGDAVDAADAPRAEVALVLGAQVYPDGRRARCSRTASRPRPRLYRAGRVRQAAALGRPRARRLRRGRHDAADPAGAGMPAPTCSPTTRGSTRGTRRSARAGVRRRFGARRHAALPHGRARCTTRAAPA